MISRINEISDTVYDEIDEMYDEINVKIKEAHPEWYDEEGKLKQEVFEDSQTYEEYTALYDTLYQEIAEKLNEEYDKELIKMGITRMKLPNQSVDGTTITEISNNAFNGNHHRLQLEKIFLPETLQTIKGNAFINQNLKLIEIPAGVTLIEAGAFSANPLEEIIFRGNIPSLGADVSVGAFAGWALQKIKVPIEYLENYKNYTGMGIENATDNLNELLEGY